VGPGVDGFAVGQPVVVSLIRHCRRCFFCSCGQPALCEATFRLDVKSPLRDSSGRPVKQGLRTGAFAESIVVHASQAVPVPSDVPAESACLLACAVMTGFGAVVHTAAIGPGDAVVVIGTGGVGLNAVQAARLSGGNPIIAMDTRASKLEVARQFGATDVINPSAEDPADCVRRMTAGRLADFVVVTVGAPSAIDDGLRLLRRAGTLVAVGMPASDSPSRLDVAAFAHDGQRILGSKMGSSRPQIDIPLLVGLYRDRRLKLDELVSNRHPLEQINQAIAVARQGDGIRTVITFDR
jgi:Zn-dependent alcohol dehydrogenase